MLPVIRPAVTVAVCTRERPEELAGCLAAVSVQSDPPDELLVVDNAPRSTLTRELAGKHGCSYACEPRPGVRFARNRALAVAQNEVVAFIDDDCRPEPGWLQAVRRQFARPGVGCCTGPLLPLELETPAQRLMENRGGFNRGFVPRLFTRDSHCHIWPNFPVQCWMFGSGGNMAFRRRALVDAGGFAPDLPWGEDLDAFFRVLRHGHALVYEPAARVRHRHVRELGALRRRLYRWGWAYSAFLARVAWNEPEYRARALREIRGYLAWHWRERCWPALRCRSDFPASLSLLEFAGALAGLPGYVHQRLRAQT
ncbi:MAG: glycosyltransferase family 2 protein [Thiohalomonadaceae bacterium]